jgi:hypothetical protein
LREQQDRCCHHYHHPRHRRPRVNRADYRFDDHRTADHRTADHRTAGYGTAGYGTAGYGTAGYGTAGYGTAGYDVRPCRGLLLARRCNWSDGERDRHDMQNVTYRQPRSLAIAVARVQIRASSCCWFDAKCQAVA